MGLAGLLYLVVYSLRASSAYSRMFWVMMGTAGPPEAPPDIKNGIWGTTVQEASKVGGAVYVCVWGGGRVRWICGISGWVSSSNCLANFSDLAEKGKTSKTCYRDCGNIWPLLGTGAAIQQVCFPIYTFFSVLSLVCRWVFSLFNHSFFSSMKKPVLLALLSSRF